MRRVFLIAAVLAVLTGCTAGSGSDTSRDSSKVTTSAATTTTEAAASQAVSESDSSAADEPGDLERKPLYDTTPVSDAYLTGDTSALDDEQLAILDKASEVLDDIIRDGMTDYEKELAVHDWIVYNVGYAEDTLNAIAAEDPHNETPYGTLINGKAVCLGYATTFRMFMDMLKIPCRYVRKPAHVSGDHAWNMVELDGHWYYVDVTWDDPTPDNKERPIKHEYFNADESLMLKEHVWDYDDYPPTDSYDYSYFVQSCRTLESQTDVGALLDEMLDKNCADCTFVIEGTELPETNRTTVFPPAEHHEDTGLEELTDTMSAWKQKDGEHNVSAVIEVVDGKPMVSVKITLKPKKE
ncbi:MAG: transglutaminase [Ruminococcus sp.]|nr:transglutaminase [Ruminococcus sp.]